MDISRRGLFRIGQGLLAAATAPQVFAAESTAADGLARLARRDFAAHLNSDFATRRPDGSTAWLKLISTEDIVPNERAAAGTRRLETFVLKFLGVGADLEQQSYEFEHTALGRFSLFLVPGPNWSYTAIISRSADGRPLR